MKVSITVTLNVDNVVFIKEMAEKDKCKAGDIIDRLINKEKEKLTREK